MPFPFKASSARPAVCPVRSPAGARPPPDGAGGQWAVAHVVLKGDRPTVDEGTLVDFATMELGPDKAPQRVIFADRLPYGLTGKIDRRAFTRVQPQWNWGSGSESSTIPTVKQNAKAAAAIDDDRQNSAAFWRRC